MKQKNNIYRNVIYLSCDEHFLWCFSGLCQGLWNNFCLKRLKGEHPGGEDGKIFSGPLVCQSPEKGIIGWAKAPSSQPHCPGLVNLCSGK